MAKYTQEVQDLLTFVGGKENVAAVTHCITRMRFVLNDPGRADIKKIEAMKMVKGSFTQAGQFQVIIGNEVAEFYKEFIAYSKIEQSSKENVKEVAKQNQNALQRTVSALAEIFAPLLPAIITGGLILGFRNCIDSIKMFEDGTKTLVEISQFWNGVNHFLWLIGEAIFHMLPVGICWSVTKKMGTTQILGITLGLTLVSGQLLNAYGVAGGAQIPYWDFEYFKINMIGYQAQVLPAILAAFTLVYLERFFKRIVPQVISIIIVPFCSIILAVIAAHFVLGPIGWKIGSMISSVVYAGITGQIKIIFAAIFGFVYAPLVITGLHHMTNAIDLQLVADYGGTMLWPMIALSNIAQGSAVLGMIFLQKKNTVAQEVNVPATISCYLGVTEPAIFGVNLKFVFPFICAMIGSSLAAILSVATNTTATNIGVGGIPGILSIQPQYMGSFAIAMAVAIAVPFVLVFTFGKKKLTKEDVLGVEGSEIEEAKQEHAKTGDSKQGRIQEEKSDDIIEIKAFLSGEVIDLKKVDDGVFSAGIMGDGLAIVPEEGVLYSPVDGKITVTMSESKHACAITMENGVEMLLHIGIDTVNMKGDGFEYLIEEGQQVKAGDPLIRFDIDKIKAANYPTATVLVITESAGKEISFQTNFQAKSTQSVIAVMRSPKGKKYE